MESKIVLSNGQTLVSHDQLDQLVASRPAQVIAFIRADVLVDTLSKLRREWDQLTAAGVDREGLAEAGQFMLADMLALVTTATIDYSLDKIRRSAKGEAWR